EETVDFRLVGHPIAREKGGQRELGKDDEPGARRVRLAHHRHQPLDNGAARISEMNRAELGNGGLQSSGHGGSPQYRSYAVGRQNSGKSTSPTTERGSDQCITLPLFLFQSRPTTRETMPFCSSR